MKTMRDDGLEEREFGRAAARVSDLRRLATSRGASIPATSPPIDGFKVVLLESFLAAIEGAVPPAGDRSALLRAKDIDAPEVQAMLKERAHAVSVPDEHKAELQRLVAGDEAVISRWMIGADVHSQWRELLRGAIASGELTAIDVFSGLPLITRALVAHAVVPTVTPPPATAVAQSGSDWKMRVQIEAAVQWRTLRMSGANPTVASISPIMAKWCRENSVLTSTHINPSERYLREHVLGGRHWNPPN